MDRVSAAAREERFAGYNKWSADEQTQGHIMEALEIDEKRFQELVAHAETLLQKLKTNRGLNLKEPLKLRDQTHAGLSQPAQSEMTKLVGKAASGAGSQERAFYNVGAPKALISFANGQTHKQVEQRQAEEGTEGSRSRHGSTLGDSHHAKKRPWPDVDEGDVKGAGPSRGRSNPDHGRGGAKKRLTQANLVLHTKQVAQRRFRPRGSRRPSTMAWTPHLHRQHHNTRAAGPEGVSISVLVFQADSMDNILRMHMQDVWDSSAVPDPKDISIGPLRKRVEIGGNTLAEPLRLVYVAPDKANWPIHDDAGLRSAFREFCAEERFSSRFALWDDDRKQHRGRLLDRHPELERYWPDVDHTPIIDLEDWTSKLTVSDRETTPRPSVQPRLCPVPSPKTLPPPNAVEPSVKELADEVAKAPVQAPPSKLVAGLGADSGDPLCISDASTDEQTKETAPTAGPTDAKFDVQSYPGGVAESRPSQAREQATPEQEAAFAKWVEQACELSMLKLDDVVRQHRAGSNIGVRGFKKPMTTLQLGLVTTSLLRMGSTGFAGVNCPPGTGKTLISLAVCVLMAHAQAMQESIDKEPQKHLDRNKQEEGDDCPSQGNWVIRCRCVKSSLARAIPLLPAQSLAVVPPGAVNQWKMDYDTFIDRDLLHTYVGVNYRDSKHEKIPPNDVEAAYCNQLIITTEGSYQGQVLKPIGTQPSLGLVILDEAHTRNRIQTQLFKIVSDTVNTLELDEHERLRLDVSTGEETKGAFFLWTTGTPMPNGPADLQIPFALAVRLHPHLYENDGLLVRLAQREKDGKGRQDAEDWTRGVHITGLENEWKKAQNEKVAAINAVENGLEDADWQEENAEEVGVAVTKKVREITDRVYTLVAQSVTFHGFPVAWLPRQIWYTIEVDDDRAEAEAQKFAARLTEKLNEALRDWVSKGSPPGSRPKIDGRMFESQGGFAQLAYQGNWWWEDLKERHPRQEFTWQAIQEAGWHENPKESPVFAIMDEAVKAGKCRELKKFFDWVGPRNHPTLDVPERVLILANRPMGAHTVHCFMTRFFPGQAVWIHSGVTTAERTKYQAGFNGQFGDDDQLEEKYRKRYIVSTFTIMGTAWNLPGAFRVLFTEPPYNLKDIIQAPARCQRTNSPSKTVHVYQLLVKAKWALDQMLNRAGIAKEDLSIQLQQLHNHGRPPRKSRAP